MNGLEIFTGRFYRLADDLWSKTHWCNYHTNYWALGYKNNSETYSKNYGQIKT